MKQPTWNIAFEISPILAASGAFGDKSGVYRVSYHLIEYLSAYLTKHQLPQTIYLYTLSPTLQFNMSIDLYHLLSLPNVKYIKGPLLTRRQLDEYHFLDKPILRYFVKKINKYIYKPILERVLFGQYVNWLNTQFVKRNIKIVHHSESGFTLFKKVQNVIHINDLIPILYPFWQRKKALGIHNNKLKFANYYCQGVICISYNTQKDFIKHFAFNPNLKNKTKVIYLGLEKFKRSRLASFSSLNQAIGGRGYSGLVNNKYFLYYGTIEPRKNIALLTSVFQQLKNQGKLRDYKLVLVGGHGWGKVYEQTQGFIRENYPNIFESQVILLDFISDEFLATLIENSYAVVYPSIYEGFGFPVIESMQFGKPVICSNSSSLPEAGGKAGYYVDPLNPDELRDAILTLAKDKKLYQRLSSLSYKQAKKFSWNKCAKETYEFYSSLMEKKRIDNSR